MNKPQPVIEILLAAFNGGRYLREQLDSILLQTDSRWHLTVSDDGSTDETPAILAEYCARYPEKITLHHSGRSFGSARDHFFHLMRQSGSPYLMFCDQDDVWYPDKVQKTFDALLQAESESGADTPLLVFTDQTPTDAQLNPLAPSMTRYQKLHTEDFDFRSLLLRNTVTGCAMAVNRALAMKAAQCQNERLSIMHDWWLAAAAARFGRIVYVDEATMAYRQHGRNSVGAKDVRSASYIVKMISGLRALRISIKGKKQQAQQFCDTYRDLLSPEEIAFLTTFAAPHSGPAFYWRSRSLIHGPFLLAGLMMLG